MPSSIQNKKQSQSANDNNGAETVNESPQEREVIMLSMGSVEDLLDSIQSQGFEHRMHRGRSVLADLSCGEGRLIIHVALMNINKLVIGLESDEELFIQAQRNDRKAQSDYEIREMPQSPIGIFNRDAEQPLEVCDPATHLFYASNEPVKAFELAQIFTYSSSLQTLVLSPRRTRATGLRTIAGGSE